MAAGLLLEGRLLETTATATMFLCAAQAAQGSLFRPFFSYILFNGITTLSCRCFKFCSFFHEVLGFREF